MKIEIREPSGMLVKAVNAASYVAQIYREDQLTFSKNEREKILLVVLIVVSLLVLKGNFLTVVQ